MMRHKTQLNQGGVNLCGQACVAMAMSPELPDITASQVARETGTLDGRFTPITRYDGRDGLLEMLGRYSYGAEAHRVPNALDSIRAALAQGKRVIALIDYRQLTHKAPNYSTYAYGHFVVVTAVNTLSGRVTFHDPLRVSGATEEPLETFKRALETPSMAGSTTNHANQFVTVSPPTLTTGKGSGINIDPRNPHGMPAPALLRGYAYARFVYAIRRTDGVVQFNEAERLYADYIAGLLSQGVRPMLILTHQTGFENAGYDFENMTPAAWQTFRNQMAVIATALAAQYPQAIIQVMNEQDTLDSRASVVVPPVEYGKLFTAVYDAVKSVNHGTPVITGGYNSGAERGWAQFAAAGITRCDGIAFHPYGASAGGLYPHDNIWSMERQLEYWRSKTALPLWITEFGLQFRDTEPPSQVARYIENTIAACSRTPNTFAPVWYAYSSYMDNAYGTRRMDGQERPEVIAALKKDYVMSNPVTPVPVGTHTLTITTQYVNARERAGLLAPVTTTLMSGQRLTVSEVQTIQTDGLTWQAFSLPQHAAPVWLALTPSVRFTPVTPPLPEDTLRQQLDQWAYKLEAISTEMRRFLSDTDPSTS